MTDTAVDELSDDFYAQFSESYDPLLHCLVLITQLKRCPVSAESLRAGLPLVNNRFTPDLFVRSAERAGLAAKLVKRQLKQISSLVLPVVILLKNNQACVLTQLDKNGNGEIIFPEMGTGVKKISLKELDKQYAGYVFFIQQKYEYENRAEALDPTKKTNSWFWGTLWRFRRYYFQIILASFFINLFAIAMPLFIMNVYDRVVPNYAIETLWVLASGVIIVFVFDFIMRSLRSFFIEMTGKKVDIILASRLFQQAMNIQMGSKPQSTGVEANYIRQFEYVRDFFTSASIAALADLPFMILFVGIIYLLAGSVAVIPLVAIPILFLIAIFINVPLRRFMKKSFQGNSQKHAILIESLNNLEVVKSASAEGAMLSRWERSVGLSANASIRARLLSQLAVNISVITHYLVMIFVVISCVYLVEARELTVGGLIACTILSGRALGPMGQITALLTRYQMAKISLGILNNMMKLPVERPDNHRFLHRPQFEGEINVDDVFFKYHDKDIDLLKGISLTIKPGERVGIIGSMGSGKTTLLKLLMGFYQATSGAIRFDGTDIAQIDPADLRRNIGYVPQDPKLFSGTVRDNISMKAPWADDQAVLDAAKVSGADSFVNRHPAGFDMLVGENGQGISGGQCQTITIARAMLFSPAILLFDEPTSYMDNSTEKLFIDNIRQFAKESTLVVVTHKMSLLELTDRLLVVQNGKIVADGEKDHVLSMLKQLQQDRG